MNNLQDIAYNLIEDMVKKHHSWGSVQKNFIKFTTKTGGLYEVMCLTI